MADINGDGAIDYEEFMKHFNDMLKRIRFMRVSQQALEGAFDEVVEEGIPEDQLKVHEDKIEEEVIKEVKEEETKSEVEDK